MTDRPLSDFETDVLDALALYPRRSTLGVAQSVAGEHAYRYLGTVGRTLIRLRDRGLVVEAPNGWCRSG